MNMRQCDICASVRNISAPWFFVTDGKSQPSEWRLAQHWCPDCMKNVEDILETLRT